MATLALAERGRLRSRRVLLALTTSLQSGRVVPEAVLGCSAWTVGFALSAALAGSITPAICHAQTSQSAPPPKYNNVDDLGIDLTTGLPNISFTEGSIGSASGGVAFTRIWTAGAGWTDNWSGGAFSKTVGGVTTWYVEHRGTTETFVQSGTTFTNQQGSGSTLSGGITGLTYTATDGTVTTYNNYNVDSTGYLINLASCSGDQGTCLLPSKITRPNGLTFTYTWTTVTRCPNGSSALNCGGRTWYRLASIKNNVGYLLSASYSVSSFAGAAPPTGWFIKTSMQYANTLGSCTTNCFAVTYPSSTTDYLVTDPLGRQWQFSGNSGPLSRIRKPGSTSDDVTIAYDANGHVSSATIAGLGTWHYAFSDSGLTRTVIITDPLGHTKKVVSDMTVGRPTSSIDGVSQTTTLVYDSNGRLSRVTAPEGNYTAYTYDTNGNVTQTQVVAKSGSGLAPLTTTASYPCASVATCNKPASTVDAKGNQTDYTYDATSGNVLTVTSPAAAVGGTRAKSTYSYTTTSGVQVLTGTSTCQTTASCVGTADEVKSTIGYNSNLLPTSVTKGAGDGSLAATTTIGYDDVGNKTSVDGPLVGSADTTTYRYDADREVVGVVAPDPDGAGPLNRAATRATYDAKGQVTLNEAGTVTDTSDTAWSAFSSQQQVATTYDGAAHPLSKTITASGATYAVTQYSYDSAGRLDCTAIRMNNAAWGSLPTSACTAQTAGSAGPDRITKYAYDNADRSTKVTTAYGTSDQSDDASVTYTNNGQTATATDANGNVTTYGYDGLDRVSTVTYPGGSYDQATYDANGNVTQRRLRDGNVINYAYDNLNRLTSKDRPNVAYWETDQSFTYDLLGRMIGASDSNGRSLGYNYDALGRQTLNSDNWYTYGNAYSQYDAAGRKTRYTWADGFYVSYDYDATGHVTAIRENGGAALVTYGYDDVGRRTSLTRANGTSTSYGYDGASRLTGLTLSGGDQPNSITLGYNPAGQITSRTASNDAYAWTAAVNADRAYGVNTLNQYTSAGATAFGYDGRGNLTSSGSDSFSYTSDNQLATAPATGLAYDPLGRLFNGTIDAGVNTTLTYDGSAVTAELDNAVPSGLLRRYVYGPGSDEPLVWYEGSGTSDRRFLAADERGSVVLVTNNAGTAIAINRYDEYGIPQSGNLGRFQYTGQKWLPTIGMYDYKARIYSPTMGRFMQTDPIGYGDGMNWYNYVGGDPVNGIDPSGLLCVVGGDGGANADLDAAACAAAKGKYTEDSLSGDGGGDGGVITITGQGNGAITGQGDITITGQGNGAPGSNPAGNGSGNIVITGRMPRQDTGTVFSITNVLRQDDGHCPAGSRDNGRAGCLNAEGQRRQNADNCKAIAINLSAIGLLLDPALLGGTAWSVWGGRAAFAAGAISLPFC